MKVKAVGSTKSLKKVKSAVVFLQPKVYVSFVIMNKLKIFFEK